MKVVDFDGTQKEGFSIGLGRLKVEFRTFGGILHFRNHKSPWYRLVGVQVQEGFEDEFKVDLTNDGSPSSRIQLPVSGLYEFYEFEAIDFTGKVYFKSTVTPNFRLETSEPRITTTPNNLGTVNIFENSGLLTIENKLNRPISLVFIRINKKLEL